MFRVVPTRFQPGGKRQVWAENVGAKETKRGRPARAGRRASYGLAAKPLGSCGTAGRSPAPSGPPGAPKAEGAPTLMGRRFGSASDRMRLGLRLGAMSMRLGVGLNGGPLFANPKSAPPSTPPTHPRRRLPHTTPPPRHRRPHPKLAPPHTPSNPTRQKSLCAPAPPRAPSSPKAQHNPHTKQPPTQNDWLGILTPSSHGCEAPPLTGGPIFALDTPTPRIEGKSQQEGRRPTICQPTTVTALSGGPACRLGYADRRRCRKA
jgi:hypothetical protein